MHTSLTHGGPSVNAYLQLVNSAWHYHESGGNAMSGFAFVLSTCMVIALCHGCAVHPTSCEIRVAPSAEPKMNEILSAAEWWNRTQGEDRCTVTMTDSELAIDGAVTVRMVPRPLVRDWAMAITRWETEGPIIVTLGQRTTMQAMAHELGHCMGLNHTPDDERNLMFPISANDRWKLTPHQLQETR